MRGPSAAPFEIYLHLMHSERFLSDIYTSSGPEEQGPPSCDKERSTCDGWKDGVIVSKDTRAVQSVKLLFSSVYSFLKNLVWHHGHQYWSMVIT